jgi:hypothetical protein
MCRLLEEFTGERLGKISSELYLLGRKTVDAMKLILTEIDHDSKTERGMLRGERCKGGGYIFHSVLHFYFPSSDASFPKISVRSTH